MIEAWWYSHDMSDVEAVGTDDVTERIDPDKGLVWIDCNGPAASELRTLLSQLGVNEFAQEDIAKAGQRTKLEHYTDHFHVAVYDCVLHAHELRPREIDVLFGAGWLLSVHQPPEAEDPGSFPIDVVRHRFELQRSQHDSAEVGLLLWALLDVVVDRYFLVTEAVDESLDTIEDAVLAADDQTSRDRTDRSRELFRLSKALVRFRRAAIPLRDVTAEISRREVACITPLAIVHFQDLADHVLRVSDFIESQRDVITGLRDAELAVASNRLSRSQQRIAAWGAIFIVATLITGVLGMNFTNAPELDWEEGFLAVFGVMVVVGLPIFAYFKHKDWI